MHVVRGCSGSEGPRGGKEMAILGIFVEPWSKVQKCPLWGSNPRSSDIKSEMLTTRLKSHFQDLYKN